MGSDAYMVSELFAAGDLDKAWGVIAMVLLNVLFQLYIVYIQKRKRPRIMAKSMVLTILCLKPAVDAIRVAGDGEREHWETFTPHVSLVMTKIAEVRVTHPPTHSIVC
jgi:hypothetical protein